MADRRGLRAEQMLRENLSATPQQIAVQEARNLTRRRIGTARAVSPVAEYTQGLRRFTERPYRQTGPVGMVADLAIGGTARYADKLARGEQMDTMDYFIPALEVPGAAVGVPVRTAQRGLRAMQGAFSPKTRAKARATEQVANPGRREAAKKIGGVTAAGLGAVAAGRIGRKVGRELEEVAGRKVAAKPIQRVIDDNYISELNKIDNDLFEVPYKAGDEAFKKHMGVDRDRFYGDMEMHGVDLDVIKEFQPGDYRKIRAAEQAADIAELNMKKKYLKEAGFKSEDDFYVHKNKALDTFAKSKGFPNYDKYFEAKFNLPF